MKYLKQPVGSNLCGQTCVAMILGISLDESVELFKSKGCTSTKQLIQVLNKYDINTDNKLRKTNTPKNNFSILKVTWNDKKSHWVIYREEKIYDPVEGIFDISDFINIIRNQGKITSELKIKSPN